MNTAQIKAFRELAETQNKKTQDSYKIILGVSCKMFGLDYDRAVEYAKYYPQAKVVKEEQA